MPHKLEKKSPLKTLNSKKLRRFMRKKGKRTLTCTAIKPREEWLDNENRYMKSSDQVKILESEFAKDPTWSKEKMRKLAGLLNLKES
jgi:hypothetical protein